MPIVQYRDVCQGDAEWVRLRLGKPTASEFHRFMTTNFELREKGQRDKYLNEKLAESLLGHALPGGGSWATEQGQMMEGEARKWFAYAYDCEPRCVGFVDNEEARCGCSPDSLIGEDAGLELKVPYPQTHIGYVRGGKVPSEYVQQVHGSLYVTGRARWYFLSYRREAKFEDAGKFVLTVERDEKIMSKIRACIAGILSEFDAALSKIKAISST